jgi:hypothetical protein
MEAKLGEEKYPYPGIPGYKHHSPFELYSVETGSRVHSLFLQFGSISAEPKPLDLDPTVPAGQSSFGFPVAARAPRQVQFALKFYF